MISNVKKTTFFAIVAFFVLMTIFSPTYAEPKNVLDCIENEAECEDADQIGEPFPLNDSNDGVLLQEESVGTTSLFFNVIKMLVALLFVLGLIYGILLILKKRNKLLQHHDLLENLGGISLGQNKSLQLIRIGSHIYVVGVGEHVDLMLEITEPEVLDALLNQENETEKESFFNQLFSRTEKDANEKQLFVNQLKEELNKLQNNRKKLVHKTIKKDDEHV